MHTIYKPYGIIIGFLVSILLIVGNLWYLQIFLNESLEQLSKKNFTRFENVLVPRGNITDTHGNLLATNRPVINIYWQGTGNNSLSIIQENQIALLANKLDLDIPRSKITFGEKYKKLVKIADDIPFSALSSISEHCTPNIHIKTHFERFYPHHMLACHIVGYLGTQNIDTKVGKMGLERCFQDELVGKKGLVQRTVDAVGSSIKQKQITPIVPGQNVKTTLDLTLQKIAERLFPPSLAGSFILMDSGSGALRVLLSRPTFNPTLFLKPISNEDWEELSVDKPFINRAYQACYPPASLFKLVTIIAGLEQDIISTESTCNCQGFMTYGKRRFRCNRHYGHGLVNIKDSLAYSCNIIFYEIGKKITINALAQYANIFGLGDKTGFSLAEQVGFIPTSEWKMQEKNERWWPGETISATIGQSFMLVTPLQIARMISGIFQGYLVNPRILEDEPIVHSPLTVKPEHLEFIRESMKEVTETGTARLLKKLEDVDIYAKTGTAQTSSLEKRKLGGKHIEHAWFVAHFSYKNYTPYTIVILLEHAGYVRIATKMTKEFIEEYKKYMDKQAT